MKLKKGEAARVYTGAMVPENADCVIMQEKVTAKGKQISVNDFEPSHGEFIRLKGSQVKCGELALPKDTYISPAVAGFLSAMGIEKVKVYRKPKVSVIITGSELVSPGKKLKTGKVYDSNSFILESALRKMYLNADRVIFIKDNKKKLKKAVSECLLQSDVIFISGGVSVGKYDFVNEVLDELGTNKLFYKVAQRPGKPLYFGKNNDTYILGFPGNPSSVLTCFYEYAYPLLRKIQGFENYFIEQKKMILLKELTKNFSLSNFVKAKTSSNGVEPLEGQASYILKSFAEADCFIYLDQETKQVEAGEEVEVHLFP